MKQMQLLLLFFFQAAKEIKERFVQLRMTSPVCLILLFKFVIHLSFNTLLI